MKRSQRLSEPSMSYESMRSVRSLRASSSLGVQPVDLIDTVPAAAGGPEVGEVAVVHMGLDMLRSVESGRAADSVASRHCGAQEAPGWSHQRNYAVGQARYQNDPSSNPWSIAPRVVGIPGANPLFGIGSRSTARLSQSQACYR